MSMLNKKGDIFTVLGIQEEKEAFTQKRQRSSETIRREDVNLFLGRIGGVRPHYSHTDYDSNVQKEQNDD